MNLRLDVHFDEGFELRNLVTEVSIQEDVIKEIRVDKMLKVDEGELVLDISGWLEE